MPNQSNLQDIVLAVRYLFSSEENSRRSLKKLEKLVSVLGSPAQSYRTNLQVLLEPFPSHPPLAEDSVQQWGDRVALGVSCSITAYWTYSVPSGREGIKSTLIHTKNLQGLIRLQKKKTGAASLAAGGVETHYMGSLDQRNLLHWGKKQQSQRRRKCHLCLDAGVCRDLPSRGGPACPPQRLSRADRELGPTELCSGCGVLALVCLGLPAWSCLAGKILFSSWLSSAGSKPGPGSLGLFGYILAHALQEPADALSSAMGFV